MKLLRIEKKIGQGTVRLSGYVQRRANAGESEVFFEFPEEFAPLVADHADPFLPALLLPSMADRDPLEIEPPVSRRLWNHLPLIQEIFGAWYSEVLTPVGAQIRQFREMNQKPKGFTGAFFSLGVDSFHTLLRHEADGAARQSITHLIFMAGFESPLQRAAVERTLPVIRAVQEVARCYGKRAIYGRTNLRDSFSLSWGAYYHGAGLAAVALALSGGLDKVLIPSSFSWRHLKPWPSNPLTDSLWSSDDMEIIHDGTGEGRAHKIADTILKHPEAVRKLRVCLVTEGGDGNCGFCGKCIRTMTTLEILGALQTCDAFPRRLPRDFWRRMQIKIDADLSFAEDNLLLARERNAPTWIITGLERAISLGQLDLLRRSRGDVRFTEDLLHLATERSFGRVRLHFGRKRERQFKARRASITPNL